MSATPRPTRRAVIVLGVIALLFALYLQLALSANANSITWDEDDHIFAGYMMWKSADFGLNPEHPPLVKLLATVPLLPMQLHVPPLQNRWFKVEAFKDGKDFVFKNDFNKIVLRTRLAAALLTVLLGGLVFVVGQEMFGTLAGFVALILLVFDPNLLAHGAVVTTDVGITLFMFASAYAFYRYCKVSTWPRLLVTGLAFGLALAAKHTGILVFPILLLLAVCEVVLASSEVRRQHMGRLARALVVIGVIGVGVLWAFYGFRYQARPDGLVMNNSLADNIAHISRPREVWAMTQIARFHLLPESYLIGLADVRNMSDFYTSFALGKTYPHGVWFYFPLAFLIKSTSAFLLLFGIALYAIASRKLAYWREILYLTVPAAFHFFIAMISRMNIGVRHILPVYAFMAVLIGGAVWALVQRQRAWAYVAGALLAYQAFTAVRNYPAYIPYANEFWGGPSQTWHLLSDSNADWGQQLKAAKRYLDQNNIHDCWAVYFAEGVVDMGPYGVPCRPLPTMDSAWMDEDLIAPPEIDGTILISAGDLSGFEFGPGKLNPYEEFKSIRPVGNIQHGIYVYQGHFKIPRAAAFSHLRRIGGLMGGKQVEQALSEAQQAAALDPESAQVQLALGGVLNTLGRKDEARAAFERAASLAQTIEPEFQQGTLLAAKTELNKLGTSVAGAP